MTNQERLKAILKHKGIGPESSKSLDDGIINELKSLFLAEDVSTTTVATLITALLTLQPNEAEAKFIAELKVSYKTMVPPSLYFFFEETDGAFEQLILKTIGKIDLTEDECKTALDHCFNKATQPFLVACFLEAQRLKRESETENATFYNYFLEKADKIAVELPYLVDLADSYDGVLRTANFSVFTACVLASLGIPTCLHGVESVAPKHGLTTYQILKAGGKAIPDSLMASAKKLIDENVKWTFLEQKNYFPELNALSTIRTEMVKRPFLATFEKLLSPIRATGDNYIVSPYTHKHYKNEVVRLLNECSDVSGFIHIKGLEATSQPLPTRESEITLCNNKICQELTISPDQYGITALKTNPEHLSAEALVAEGLNALNGENNDAASMIKYQSCLILTSFFEKEPLEAKRMVDTSLIDGAALNAWENF